MATTDAAYTPLGVRLTRWIPHYPHPPQEAFLWLDGREALYGGAAGGGKSDALLMAALQYVDLPGYSALILRRTYPDLALPGAIMDRSKEWLSQTDARWNDNDRRWTFPSGATLTFGFLEIEKHKYRYQGAEFHFIGFDELTQFGEGQYRYLLSRLRRLEGSQIPIRMRAASNPGGIGHEWVRERFLTNPQGRVFVPAKVTDNPSLDVEQYVSTLQDLDHHTRRQLLEGDWDARPPGDLFRRDWFDVVDEIPDDCRWIRFWDLAATEPSDANPDPDWTVGLRLGLHPNGTMYVEHVERLRAMPKGVSEARRAMADRDGQATHIYVEQEPGSSGKTVVHEWVTGLADRTVYGYRNTGSKWDRATVVSSKAEHGLIRLKRGAWNTAFLDELEAFTQTDDHPHDDQVDALSGAVAVLAAKAGVQSVNTLSAGREPVIYRGDLVLRGERFIDKP